MRVPWVEKLAAPHRLGLGDFIGPVVLFRHWLAILVVQGLQTALGRYKLTTCSVQDLDA